MGWLNYIIFRGPILLLFSSFCVGYYPMIFFYWVLHIACITLKIQVHGYLFFFWKFWIGNACSVSLRGWLSAVLFALQELNILYT